MFKRSMSETRRQLVLCLLVLGFITAIIAVPYQFGTSAASKKGGLVTRTVSGDDSLPKMWDIREQADAEYTSALARFRQSVGLDASRVADVRDGFVRGEQLFRQQHPGAKVEYNLDIRTPEILTPNVSEQNIRWLTAPTTANRATALRDFIKGYNELIGLTDEQIDTLRTAANYVNPDGNLSFVRLEQEINGIPVFRGEMTAGFRNNGQMIRVVNNLAPGMEYGRLSANFGDPLDAVTTAAKHTNHELRAEDVTRNDAESTDLRVVFGGGDWATTAEKMYFPTEPGVAVPSWRVLIWRPVNAYYVIVDAQSGVVLWHKNISDDQTQAATYQIYGNSNAYINAADHAAPLSPGPNDPGLGTQGALLTRTNVTLIGNEGANSFNNNGWVTDATNITDGNANEAGIDRVSPNGVDAPMVGAPNRVFDSTWNPPPGSPAPGDDPLTAQAQRGAVIQMFYLMNLYHDELYKRGFNEPARNFQHDNFGRGGIGADRVSSEGQDSSGTNNANFSTPADGGRGRMQMFLWTGPTPDRDGTADAAIVIHEVTHGTSNRTHGNGSGLGNQGGMMGEGWGDWYAHTMTAEPTDPINAVYGLGGYSLLDLGGPWTANHYYGIRRFPTAVKAFTGGPNNLPHNPLTFGHINTGCDTTLGTPTTAVSSAYPRNPKIATSGSCSQVHNAGEIWKSALWEVRALMIARLGFAVGTTRVLDVVTNGMKTAPLNPTMLQERDAIVAIAAAIPLGPETTADADDVREGFRIRGMGCFASVQTSSSVTENFAPCTPDFTLAVTPTTQAICVPANATYTVNTTSLTGFTDPITLSATGNPGATTVTFSPNPVTPGNSATMTVSNTAGLAAGSYTINVIGTSGALVHNQNVTLNVFDGTPAAPTLTSPANGSTAGSLQPTFTWGAVAGAATYEIQVATDAGFTNVVASATGLATPSFTPASPLASNTPFFWRVRAVNPCAIGAYSTVFSFSTPCITGYNPTTQPGQTIPPGGTFVPLSDDDDFVVAIPLPAGWASTVYGLAVTSLSATTNGNMRVNGAAATTFTNTALPAAQGGTNPTLLPWWDDLDMDALDVTGGGIFTNTIGSAPNRQFYVEWRAQHFSETINGPITINFAIMLTEGSDVVRYIYALTGNGTTANGASATVGIQREQTGTNFSQFSFNTASLSPGLQITYTSTTCGGTPTPTPPPATPSPTPPPVTPTPTPTPTPPPATPTPTPPPATPSPSPTCTPGGGGGFTEAFESGLPTAAPLPNHASPGATLTLASGSWHALNVSAPIGTTGVFGSNLLVAHGGVQHAAMNFNNGSGTSAISTFLMSPVVTLNNGDTVTFWTRTVTAPAFPDRMRLVMSTNGASTNAADFTTVLVSVNEGLTLAGYPNVWTQFTGTVSGLGGATSGRFAFNYNVPNGGPSGVNSDFIGIDDVVYAGAGGGCGTPTPPPASPTPTPATPTPTPPPASPTPTVTPTPGACQSSQNFDGVTAPALPAGWTSTATGALGPWVTGTPADAGPNAAVNGSVASVSDAYLDSPTIPIAAGGGSFSFRIDFNTENGFDGAVLEISINGGAFADIVTAGGSFVTGGYTGTISTAFSSPIAGRMAWEGPGGGYITSTVNLPAAANGQNIVLRWRNATDNSVLVTGGGVRVDTITGIPCAGGGGPTPTPTPSPSPTPSPASFSITFTQPTYTEDESQTAVIGVTRSGDLSGTNTVNFMTSNGTAVGGAAPGPGIDYQTVNQSVTFNPGDTLKTVNVPIFGDSATEPTETVNLTLTGAGTLAPEVQNAVLNINDTANLFRRGDAMCTTLGGTADLYPSTINVAGGPIQIGAMRVTLYDLEHTFPDHLDILLVGPGGQEFVLMGDAGGGIAIPSNNTVTLSLRDAGPGVLPNSGPLVTGNFEPTTWETPVTNFPGAAPAGPYNEPGSTVGGTGTQTLFGTFGLTNSNGIWSLYIRDDAGVARTPEAISGCFNGGWGIEFLTSTAANASISGRVLTAGGNGIRNAEVVISGGTLTEPMRVQTGSFGYYNFEGLQTGQTYIITVNSRRYVFSVPTRVVTLSDNIADLDFVAIQTDATID